MLGQGGFGITYLAVDCRTNAQVVIKENLPTFYAVRDDATLYVRPLAVEDAVENYTHTLRRFVDEARILAHLNHPNIVRVLDAFEALGTAYYVMPYIEAKELHRVIPTEAVNEAWLLPILTALLSALDYLHGQNLLHRDLKPGNILLQADGTPILIDFGTARALQTERSATMVGTPGYTPLEQITPHGKRGPWTDIYALGATCYRLITGVLPPQAVERIDVEDPYRPLASRAELLTRFSPALLGSIDKALSVRANARWQSAREWSTALAAPAGVQVSPQSTSSEVGKNRLPLILSLLTLLLIGGGYGVYAYLDAEEQEHLNAEQAFAEAKRVAQEQAECLKREAAARLVREEAERLKREEAESRLALEEAERLKREEEAERESREAEAQKARAEAACAEYIQTVLVAHAGAPLPKKNAIPIPEEEGLVQTLQELSAQGDHDAEFVFSVLLEHGLNMQPDKTQALQMLRKAAEGDNAQARVALAKRYETGTGVPKDAAEAVKWYRKAAEQGYAEAQAQLGNCYRHAIGVAKNHDEAVKWFRKAAEQGNAMGQNCLGACYYGGDGVAKDVDEALKWIRRAAEQGHTAAQYSLGYCYHQGIGVIKDHVEGVRWYLKAAEQGDATGQYSLGYCYHQGIGVAKDNVEAVKWFRKAAEQGNAKAQQSMGYCYANGLGVRKDSAQAIEWYRKSARQGNESAQSALRKMGETW